MIKTPSMILFVPTLALYLLTYLLTYKP